MERLQLIHAANDAAPLTREIASRLDRKETNEAVLAWLVRQKSMAKHRAAAALRVCEQNRKFLQKLAGDQESLRDVGTLEPTATSITPVEDEDEEKVQEDTAEAMEANKSETIMAEGNYADIEHATSIGAEDATTIKETSSTPQYRILATWRTGELAQGRMAFLLNTSQWQKLAAILASSSSQNGRLRKLLAAIPPWTG